MVYLKVSRRVASQGDKQASHSQLDSTQLDSTRHDSSPVRLTIEHLEPEVEMEMAGWSPSCLTCNSSQSRKTCRTPVRRLPPPPRPSWPQSPKKPKIHLPEITNYGTCSYCHYRRAMAQTPTPKRH